MIEVQAIQFKNDTKKTLLIWENQSDRWQVEPGKTSGKFQFGKTNRICREDNDDINYSLIIDSDKKIIIPFTKLKELNWKIMVQSQDGNTSDETVNVTIGENEPTT